MKTHDELASFMDRNDSNPTPVLEKSKFTNKNLKQLLVNNKRGMNFENFINSQNSKDGQQMSKEEFDLFKQAAIEEAELNDAL